MAINGRSLVFGQHYLDNQELPTFLKAMEGFIDVVYDDCAAPSNGKPGHYASIGIGVNLTVEHYLAATMQELGLFAAYDASLSQPETPSQKRASYQKIIRGFSNIIKNNSPFCNAKKYKIANQSRSKNKLQNSLTAQLQKLVIMIIYITLSILVCSIHANAEANRYRFDLVAGKKNEVCRHMYKVYNRHFSQLFNMEAAKKELYDLFVSTYRKPEILYSFYPTSPEFEAIKWDIREYIDPNHKPKNEGIALISHIDIDNDGIDDTLVKIVFYSIGSHYSERLIIASNFKPKQTGPIRYDDFYRNQPISIGYAAILRPFLFKGITYLHWYEFEQPKGDATPDPTVYSKWIIIRKYLGTIFDKTGNYETKYEDICKFNVIDIEIERSIQEMQKKMHKKGE